jgi:hypothetical protein
MAWESPEGFLDLCPALQLVGIGGLTRGMDALGPEGCVRAAAVPVRGLNAAWCTRAVARVGLGWTVLCAP